MPVGATTVRRPAAVSRSFDLRRAKSGRRPPRRPRGGPLPPGKTAAATKRALGGDSPSAASYRPEDVGPEIFLRCWHCAAIGNTHSKIFGATTHIDGLRQQRYCTAHPAP
jgi:hypothetical protein